MPLLFFLFGFLFVLSFKSLNFLIELIYFLLPYNNVLTNVLNIIFYRFQQLFLSFFTAEVFYLQKTNITHSMFVDSFHATVITNRLGTKTTVVLPSNFNLIKIGKITFIKSFQKRNCKFCIWNLFNSLFLR